MTEAVAEAKRGYSRDIPADKMPDDLIGRYAIVARWVSLIARREKEMSTEVLAVAMCVAKTIGPYWRTFMPVPVKEIARNLGCSRSVAIAALDDLVDAGWLQRRTESVEGAPLTVHSFRLSARPKE